VLLWRQAHPTPLLLEALSHLETLQLQLLCLLLCLLCLLLQYLLLQLLHCALQIHTRRHQHAPLNQHIWSLPTQRHGILQLLGR
jgi:hypothetical protein